MPTNSREKGKRGEREFCRLLREHGYGAYRSAQHAGIAERDDSADVITSLEPVRFEIKRGKNNHHLWHRAVQGWIDKAIDETPSTKRWCVGWRPDRAGWFFFLSSTGARIRTCYDPLRVDGHKPIAAPWLVVPGAEAMLSILDPLQEYRVENPKEWMLRA